MTDPSGGTRARTRLALVLIAAAVVLIIVHFSLDAGSGREAPGWVIYASIGCAVAATLAGSISSKR